MKRLFLVVLCFALIGCATTRHKFNKWQEDIEYFEAQVVEYTLIVNQLEQLGHIEDATKAKKSLAEAKELLADAKIALQINDKINADQHLSALIDILVLRKKYEDKI